MTEVDNYLNLAEPTSTGCPKMLDGRHEFIWAKRLGMQECEWCGVQNWVGMDDPRLGPAVQERSQDDGD